MRAWTNGRLATFLLGAALVLASGARAQIDPTVYTGMRWRLAGPFRGGRVLTVTGIAGEANIYYFGSVGGGVWKTTDGGNTWDPIFDSVPIGSIGALAVAPSKPDVIYAGTGEADMRADISIGAGMYRSADGGKSWTPIGLDDSRQIARILVDPSNPDLVLVAALGHAYGPNEERGVFRTTDGGRSWQKVLYKDPNTGAIDIAFDPANPRNVFAVLWQTRRPPWSVYAPTDGPGGGLYRSTDEGMTWTEMDAGGLPPKPWGRVGIAVAPSGGGKILYALVSGAKNGVYRSNDGGATWQLAGSDPRVLGRQWYFGGIFIDPKHADVVYVANTSVYRSTDGGRSWQAFKGAPGGDDYHDLWIDPEDPGRIIAGSDQGTTLTVDGGAHWSSWYNQPTAQIYHVSTDNDFPYRIYGAQQDSGGMSILSRSDYGKISFRDWFPGWGGESGWILADPNDSNTIYASTTGGGVERYDRRTQQALDIAPYPFRAAGGAATDISAAKYRFPWTPALALDPFDSHTLYLGSQALFRSTDRGSSWQVISPDLTGAAAPARVSKAGGAPTPEDARQRGYGVINSIAPSPVEHGLIWVGSDTGLVNVSRDNGQTWASVTPRGMEPWSRIALVEPSHFDAGTAYLAVNRHRLDDYTPSIYRTHDFGQTWTRINAGIEAPAYVHSVREDPAHRGLLFAGTETGVYVSFDDGDHWQSLQLNLPATPVRDLTIHATDLVIATHGRSFWILDNITPLRQAAEAAPAPAAFLFQPRTALRVRPGNEHGTPLPPEIAAGENPPEGAIIDYFLKGASRGAITLEILDSQGQVVRRYSSADRPASPSPSSLPFPAFWVKAPEPLPATAGMHRFVWDLRYAATPGGTGGFGFRGGAGGPWAVPGQYQVRLTVDGQAYTQPLALRIDPRVEVSLADLQKQFDLAMKIQARLESAGTALGEARNLRAQLKDRGEHVAAAPATLEATEALDRKVAALVGGESQSGSAGSFAEARSRLARLAGVVESADAAPTATAESLFDESSRMLDALLGQWNQLKSVDLPALNQQLTAAGAAAITLAPARQ
ncbi:MAG TPA: hypothetical protein VGS20_10885 [Candidatus Acidoferrales bacterium]|nr:hypothetical protein [Candidatus Acidoferrales bacterium]